MKNGTLVQKLIMITLAAVSARAIAMPCDVGAVHVVCQSASGKYAFTTGTACGFDANPLDRDIDLKVSGQTQAAFKNVKDWYGDKFDAIRFEKADQYGDVGRVISFEWSTQSGKGLVTDSHRDGDPAPWIVDAKEPVTCHVIDDRD